MLYMDQLSGQYRANTARRTAVSFQRITQGMTCAHLTEVSA